MAIPSNADLKLVVEVNMPDSVTALNIYYFKTEFTDPQQDQDVLDALEGWVETLYATVDGEIVSGVTLGVATLYEYNTPLLQWDNKGNFTPEVSFTAGGDMLPHGVAAMVRMYSTEPRTIGRKYIPGFDEAAQADGDWIGGTITHLGDFLTAWRSQEVISSGNVMYSGVWTTKYYTVYRRGESGVVLAQPAYQRRRRPGVGM